MLQNQENLELMQNPAKSVEDWVRIYKNMDLMFVGNVLVKPVSKITKAVLEIMKDNHYIGAYTIIDDGKGGFIEINLIGGVNKCGAIKPRFAATVKEYDKFEKRFLPSKDFGIIILSTSKGIMTQDQAK